MSDRRRETSHVEALKSTSIIGGSTALSLVIRMVRTKVVAVFLGPGGVGLEAVYDAVVSVARSAVDSGIGVSGVRRIAAAAGSGDQPHVARTVFALKRICLALGVIGAVILYAAREPISRVTFGDAGHASEIGWLSLILLFAGVMGGQGAILQGMRKIGDLARVNILGTALGAAISIPIVCIWGRAGIPAYMVIGTGAALLVSWLYSRRIPLEPVKLTFREMAHETNDLFRLGFVFMWSALLSTGAMFLIRAFVTWQEGIEGVGQFQAANALAIVYVGFVLQAMGTDFYPRLTAVAENNSRCNQLVNEQAEISILLALPGILATLALAPWIIQTLYSSKFGIAAAILSWQVAGMFLRVCSWPMGFIVMAKGRAAALFWTELAAYGVYTLLAWIGLKWFGLPGTGMAFLGLYVFHWTMMYFVVSRMSGFRWSPENVRLSLLGVATVAITLIVRLKLAEPWATVIGGVLAIATGIFCMKTLAGLVGPDRIDRFMAKLRLPIQVRNLFCGPGKAVAVPSE